MIPYGRQRIDEADINAVTEVLRSDFLTQGPAVPRFESALAQVCGGAHVVAVNSATSALHLACLALGVSTGDTVWTSPNTFVASANCARYCGAVVDFVDIAAHSLNLCPEQLAAKLEHAARNNILPKVVIPVHFAGEPCDMTAIHALSQRYGFRIIEDASHALGARYQGSTIGDCAHSDITVFSFHPVKIITTGEGGAASTNDASLAQRMRVLSSHGIVRDRLALHHADMGNWYYEQQSLGYNYRMTDMQAALGCSQLEKLEEWIVRRHQLAARYDAALKGLPIELPLRQAHSRSALHLYPIQTPHRRKVFDAMRAAGIGVNVHYIPVHTQPDYRVLGFVPGQFPASEAYYERALSLPLHPSLTDKEQDYVVRTLRGALA